MKPVGWSEARRIARAAGQALGSVDVALSDALGSALATPLIALSALPTYDAAAMDGYAVAGSGPWRVTGRLLAGDPPLDGLSPGYAVEIATGAWVPTGVDAVLPYERACRRAGTVAGEIEAGRHIRRRGEDCPAGRELLAAGAVVTPAVLGLAASVGYDRLAVHRRPSVGVVLTGTEVRSSGLPAPGTVRDAIGPLLPGLVHWAGGRLTWWTRLADDKAALVSALRRHDADVVVVCGATSVGAADHLRGALDTMAARIRIHGVACRPGHPQLFASLPDGRFIVGLPGNPFAALVAGITVLEPLLGRLSGRGERQAITARLTRPLRAHEHDTRLVGVTRAGSSVVPVGHDRPGSLWGAACADALVVVPPRWDGAEVELLPLPDGGAAPLIASRAGSHSVGIGQPLTTVHTAYRMQR